MHEKLTLESLCSALSSGDISAAEVREQALMVESQVAGLNCFIRDGDAGQHFGKADVALKGSPLWGVPISFKDAICVAGLPVTAGTPALSGFMARHDAAIVRELKALGAVVAGKNNMHELSFGVTSVNPHWGTVGNPAAPGYCAGGSSGGSAAAVASGIVPVSVGTDTGGSVRIPAAFCGIAGFRPSTGRWSCEGVIPVSHTKDSVGLLTASAADAAYLYGLMAGSQKPLFERADRRCRIGLPASMWLGLAEQVEKHCLAAITRLQHAGFECVAIDDAQIDALNRTLTFTVPLYEFFTDFPRTLFSLGWEDSISSIFDKIRDTSVSDIINTHSQGGLITPADYSSAMYNFIRLRSTVETVFKRHAVDLLAYPTVPCAVPHLNDADHPELFSQVIRNTDLASNAGMPSITLPVAPKGMLPVGLSLDSPRGTDTFLLSKAAAIEDVLKG